MSKRIELLFDNYPALTACEEEIRSADQILASCYESGNKVLLCGNGGSASDADHIAGELLKGFQSKRVLSADARAALGENLAAQLEEALPAIPLTSFPALGTAYANDVHGDYTFAQLTWGLGRPGDVLWCLTTSGNSTNVLHACAAAKARGMTILGMTGEGGGKLAALCDVCIRVPSSETFRVQEYHLPIYHVLCLLLEDRFFG